MEENDPKLDVSAKAKDEGLIPPKDSIDEAVNFEVKNSIPGAEPTPLVAKDEVVSKKSGKKRSTVDANNSSNTPTPIDIEENVKLKRRKIKAAGAPKMPLNGYVRYMNDRRESLRREFPDKTAIEHTRIIGEEWQRLTVEKKTPYMEAAEVDRQRYNVELQEFLRTHPDVWANEIAKSKAQKNASIELSNQQKEKSLNNSKSKQTQSTLINQSQNNNNNNKGDEEKLLQTVATNAQISDIVVEKSVSPITTTFSGNCSESIMSTTINNNSSNNCTNPFGHGEIPIFTNEFLEHNKILENELRALRKSRADLEQQNAVLEKHVDNMKCGVKKLSSENIEWQEKLHMLENYYDKLKQRLVKALSNQQLTNEQALVTLENIEKYMANLRIMSDSNIQGPCNFQAHDIIQKLDLQVPIEK